MSSAGGAEWEPSSHISPIRDSTQVAHCMHVPFHFHDFPPTHISIFAQLRRYAHDITQLLAKESLGHCRPKQPRTLTTECIGTKSQRLTIEYDGQSNSTLQQIPHLSSIFKTHDAILLRRFHILEVFEPATIHDCLSLQRKHMGIGARYCITLRTIFHQASLINQSVQTGTQIFSTRAVRQK
jgi:hypothetical protein